jgi:hypothetical protein
MTGSGSATPRSGARSPHRRQAMGATGLGALGHQCRRRNRVLRTDRPDASRRGTDLYDFRLRPNSVIEVPDVYKTKAERWMNEWPRLVVEPWPHHG